MNMGNKTNKKWGPVVQKKNMFLANSVSVYRITDIQNQLVTICTKKEGSGVAFKGK